MHDIAVNFEWAGNADRHWSVTNDVLAACSIHLNTEYENQRQIYKPSPLCSYNLHMGRQPDRRFPVSQYIFCVRRPLRWVEIVLRAFCGSCHHVPPRLQHVHALTRWLEE